MGLTELINKLAKTLPAKYSEDSFYNYVRNSYAIYVEDLNNVSNTDFQSLMNGVGILGMKGSRTKKRFIDLISKIQECCLLILKYAYKGDLLESSSMLERLLTVQKYTQYKLSEPFCNYFKLDFNAPHSLYRCRDEKNKPEDCWHLPFQKRFLSTTSRFNISGYPCMYLADSIECAASELGELVNPKKRWVQEFIPKRRLLFLNLSMPAEEDIMKMSDYDRFTFLIVFPIAQLCLAKTKTEEKFHAEYLFSQLFLHTLFLHNNVLYPSFDGICYTSTEGNGRNYVIPAKYDGLEPIMSGYSQFILDILEPTNEPEQV